MELRDKIREQVISARILAKTVDEAVYEILLLFDVSGRSEQLCSCSSKILPDGNIQFSLCRKCQIEMKEHN